MEKMQNVNRLQLIFSSFLSLILIKYFLIDRKKGGIVS